jgi:hypothetical protein
LLFSFALTIVSLFAAPVMSATAAAAGQGVVGGVMRQRVSLGLVKDEPPSSPSFLSKSHTHTNKTAYSEQMHMINVDLAVEGAEGSGRQFHTPTGIQLQTCLHQQIALQHSKVKMNHNFES